MQQSEDVWAPQQTPGGVGVWEVSAMTWALETLLQLAVWLFPGNDLEPGGPQPAPSPVLTTGRSTGTAFRAPTAERKAAAPGCLVFPPPLIPPLHPRQLGPCTPHEGLQRACVLLTAPGLVGLQPCSALPPTAGPAPACDLG